VAAVGAFVIGGLALFAAGLFLIGDRRMFFTDTFEVYAEFKEVAALDNGAKVRVAGVDAGEVEEIRVPSGPSGKFRVKMRVRKDLHPLIRVDSVASIQNDGLVGNKFVQIQTGTDQAAQVAEKGTILSREPFDVADLLQSMSDTITTVNGMLAEVKGNVDEALDALTSTANDAQGLMADVGDQVKTIMASTRKVTGDLSAITANVRGGRGTVGKLLTDDSLFASAKGMAADAEKAMATVRQASEDARAAIADLRGDKGPVKGLTGDVQQTLQSARDAMSDLAEATEAMKRNFLFRGFFNRRGYFDLDDVTPAQYREGALQTKDRRVLRIWLAAGLLFERDANGEERLSEGGAARLDSAMSQFLRYPQKSPFVIEGYAQDVTGDVRYLSSRRRAQLVRDYVVGKYKLDPNYVATMPMGAEAEGSPSGDRWDGAALAMFVSTRAL
jgi:phospholipid/cholesterol/gamma-HCH transport system substrate-binding protein